jgi:hypothetical protein
MYIVPTALALEMVAQAAYARVAFVMGDCTAVVQAGTVEMPYPIVVDPPTG